jgi:hypothetical protein
MSDREDVFAVAEHAKWLIEHGRGNEPAKIILHRVEAQKRKANKEGKTRLVKDLHNAQAYADWHKEFDRYVTIAVDPNVAYSIMLRLLQQLPDSSIKRLAADEQIETGSLSDAD